jgi:branched-chain amino acid transport system permease protein
MIRLAPRFTAPLLYFIAAGLVASLPLYLNAYWVDVLNSVGLYAILGLSLNLIVGHAGLFNLGHAAFYAVGAYTAAILNTKFQIPVMWLLPLCAITAGLFALLIARPIIHLRGDYLCIVTIGVGEIVRIALINNIFGITGGANGIFGIARPSIFGYVVRKPHEFFYLIWFFLAFTVFLFKRLEHSRFGRALNYLREDDVAAEGSGVNVTHYKLAAFVVGAAWAGMAGNLFAAKMTIISPESFSFWESVLIFTLIILGGSGNIAGVLLGAVLIVGLPELFRDFANARMLVFGAAMILMMIFRKGGILPTPQRKYDLAQAAGGEGEGRA